jgi:C-terminal processing protease CtpA/Prc
MTFLTETQRRSVFENIIRLIDTRFMGADPDTPKLRQEHEATVIGSETPEKFEQAIDALLRALGTSHTGMFHESRPRSAGRIAMAATLTKAETSDGLRWVFQDVHPGGVAAAAGISPGDVLIAIGEQELIPPSAIPFRLGGAVARVAEDATAFGGRSAPFQTLSLGIWDDPEQKASAGSGFAGSRPRSNPTVAGRTST